MSDRPQTTRTQIRGVRTTPTTPAGAARHARHPQAPHAARRAHQRPRPRDARGGRRGVPRDRGVGADRARRPLRGRASCSAVDTPSVLVVNKTDVASPGRRSPSTSPSAAAELGEFDAFVPLSARTGAGVDALVGELEARLPEGPHYYPDGMVTDQPESFLAAELVREQLLRVARDELPHSITVVAEDRRPRATDPGRRRLRPARAGPDPRGARVAEGDGDRQGRAVLKEAGTRGPGGARAPARHPRAPRDAGDGRARLAAARPRPRPARILSESGPSGIAGSEVADGEHDPCRVPTRSQVL